MKKILPLLIIIPMMLSGCWDQKIFEKIAFTLEIGIEKSKEEGKYLITETSPAIGAKEQFGIEIVSTSSEIMRGAIENVTKMSSREVEGGKIQQVLFSEDVAREGIHDFLEIFSRDPELPLISWVVVVEGSPKGMFEKASDFKDIPGPALYINQLIMDNVKDMNTPKTRIYNFEINYFAPGIDPVTPLIRLEENDILVVGSAVFSGDRMVGRLDNVRTAMLLCMTANPESGLLSYAAPFPPEMPKGDKDKFAVTLTDIKRKIEVKIENSRPIVDLKLSFNAYMEEYVWDALSKESNQKIVEEQLSDSIKKDCMETLDYLRQVGSDPIGIGELVRARYYDYWKDMDWINIYKDAQFNMDVEVNITEYGSID